MMQRILLTTVLVIVWTVCQATDTIYVNQDQHAYLVFDEEVSLLDLGGEREYGVDIPENVVLVKNFAARAEKNAVYLTARSDAATETSIFIQAGNKAYVGVVCFNTLPSKLLYDLREKTMNKAASYDRRNYVPEVDVSLIEDRLYQLDEEKRSIHDIGVSNNKVDWSLTNLRVDNSAIYLKLRLENQSALVYRIESISVENAEFYRKRLLSKKKVNKVPVEPLVEGSIVDVRPYDQHDYYVAIPVYAVGDQGAVLVTIRETSGIRSLQLEIPPRLMANADLF